MWQAMVRGLFRRSRKLSRQDGTCQLKVGFSFGSSLESWSSFDPKQPMLLTGFITLLVCWERWSPAEENDKSVLENLQQTKKLGNQAMRRYQGIRDATRRIHARLRALRERKLLQSTIPKILLFFRLLVASIHACTQQCRCRQQLWIKTQVINLPSAAHPKQTVQTEGHWYPKKELNLSLFL